MENILKITKLFLFQQKKKLKNVYTDGNENIVRIYYNIKCIDSARFMVSSLSNLDDNLAEEIHKVTLCKNYNCFFEYDDNLVKGIHKVTLCKNCNWFFEYERVNANFISSKFLSCSKNYSQ